MKRIDIHRLMLSVSALLLFSIAAAAQTIKVEAPSVVALDEQFNVTFIIEGTTQPKDFSWSPGSDFQLVWGPQKGVSRSTSIVNGKRTSSSQVTYTYILHPKSKGTFSIPAATASLGGSQISSRAVNVEVVSNGASSSQGGSSQGGGSSSSQGAAPSVSSTGDISSQDLFMTFSLSRNNVVMGEPITATLKLYQRVNIAGFEDAKFPTFNGFWSQETYSPTNIEFKRESYGDKIYNTAVLRSYVIIPQQTGTLHIDPSELVVLVNVKVPSKGPSSIFDSFFDDDYRTVRKRLYTSGATVNVSPLPGGAPAYFGGGVGQFSLKSRIAKDSLRTHDAASLYITVSGRGNVSLLEAPKVNFPPDFEVYDVKVSQDTDKSGTSGSKTFEYPFIPRSHGEFTIDPIEYSYYDPQKGSYVTIATEPLDIKVAKGSGDDSSSPSGAGRLSTVDRKGVKDLNQDIRYIQTRTPSLKSSRSFLVGKSIYWIIVAFLVAAALLARYLMKDMAAKRADVAGTKNRRATKMALGRLKKASEYLSQNLYTPFYEELHKALLGFASDKLNLSGEDLSRDNISEKFLEGGVGESLVNEFISLLDACEEARYSPSEGSDAMKAHYDRAVEVISSIDSGMKTSKGKKKGGSGAAALLIAALLIMPSSLRAQDAPDSLWNKGVRAFEAGMWSEAATTWEKIIAQGIESPQVYCNTGDAYFRDGNYPRAILNYERALKVDPSYKDARYNLEMANSRIQDKIEEVPEFFLKGWLRKVCYLLSSNTWAVLSLLFLGLALGMLLLFQTAGSSTWRKVGFFSAIVLALLMLLSFAFARWERNDYINADKAIVVKAVSSVKSSPTDGGATDLFVLHEGTKVRLLDQVGSWRNISLSDGRQGWIKDSDIEVI